MQMRVTVWFDTCKVSKCAWYSSPGGCNPFDYAYVQRKPHAATAAVNNHYLGMWPRMHEKAKLPRIRRLLIGLKYAHFDDVIISAVDGRVAREWGGGKTTTNEVEDYEGRPLSFCIILDVARRSVAAELSCRLWQQWIIAQPADDDELRLATGCSCHSMPIIAPSWRQIYGKDNEAKCTCSTGFVLHRRSV